MKLLYQKKLELSGATREGLKGKELLRSFANPIVFCVRPRDKHLFITTSSLLTNVFFLLKKCNNLTMEELDISIPTKKKDYYLVDASQQRKNNPENYPEQSKDQKIRQLFVFLKENNRLPKPGFSLDYFVDEDLQEFRKIYGERLVQGSKSEVYCDLKTNEATHLWKIIPIERKVNITKLADREKYIKLSEKVAAQNVHQMELNKKLSGQHPFFSFVREVPGGWTEKYFPNQGNLKEYLANGGKLTQEQVEKAIKNLKEMQNLAREAHGDIVKRPDFVPDFNRGLMQQKFDSVERLGYINFENILVGVDGELIIRDFAGNSDPIRTGGWDENEGYNPKSAKFMSNELQFFSEGLNYILERQKSNSYRS